jgi:predicted HicB family RNase H-like nuclease
MKKASVILRQAVDAARSTETWADLSNALFAPFDGLVTKAYRTHAQRAAFRQSEEYKKIRELLAEKIKATGLVAGATPRKSGKFVVRLPQSMHAALEHEAAREGISLNQLVVAKLAFQLGTLTKGNGGQTAGEHFKPIRNRAALSPARRTKRTSRH